MRGGPRILALLLALSYAGCTVNRGGQAVEGECRSSVDCALGEACTDGFCLSRPDSGSRDAGPTDRDGSADAAPEADAGAPEAGSRDAGAPEAGSRDAGSRDAGPPAGCTNGSLDGDETDTDCGGACPACAMCRACDSHGDCLNGRCSAGRCEPVLAEIMLPGVGPTQAYVREDGAVLLAHYGPGTLHRAYNPAVSQKTSVSGGGAAPIGWAPDPCEESGHLAFRDVRTEGWDVSMACGTDPSNVLLSVSSGSLFTDFTDGDKGVYGAVGETSTSPGWGHLSSVGYVGSRYQRGACGEKLGAHRGGIAYCDGLFSDVSPEGNHLVSFSVHDTNASPIVGCNRAACTGPSCPYHVWLWLVPR